jgi:hypothetical protein
MNPVHPLLVAALLAGATVPAIAADEILLYGQTAPLGDGGPPSSHYIHSQPMTIFDSQAADDFVVPAGETWSISRLVFDGEYRSLPGPAASLDLALYADQAGQPGAALSQATHVKGYVDEAGVLSVSLPRPVTLAAGTYWLSVRANIDYQANGLWAFTSIAGAVGHPAVWRNPASGYHLPCPDWQPQAVCFGGAPGDLRFEIHGRKP